MVLHLPNWQARRRDHSRAHKDTLARGCTENLEAKVDRFTVKFMQRLRAEDVNKPFSFTVSDGPEKGQLITWTLKGMLWHHVEEELKHRGEINALLWQEDINPPVTSWWS